MESWNGSHEGTKPRRGEAGCAGAAFVALGKRVWCLATFVDLVSYRASHDSPRNPKGVQPQSPGLRRRGATPGTCPTYKQPQRGCAEATSGEAPAVWLDPAEWATPSWVFNISTHPVGGIDAFGASAQPRCGCCGFPIRTRGSAENRATPGFGAEHRWCSGRGRWHGRDVEKHGETVAVATFLMAQPRAWGAKRGCPGGPTGRDPV